MKHTLAVVFAHLAAAVVFVLGVGGILLVFLGILSSLVSR